MGLAWFRASVLAATGCVALLPATTITGGGIREAPRAAQAQQQQPPVTLPPQPASEQAATTASEQVDLSVAVYNSDLALVRDVRQLALPSGTFALRFADVAAAVNPATVHLRSLNDPGTLSVLEQNYEYDLLDPEKLLRKYVGREVTLVRERQENGTTRTEEVKALLLAYNQGPVWRIGNEIVTGMRADHYRFPRLPENLFSHPTLIWSLENRGPARHRVEASYLTGGLSWNADYVLTVARDDRSADITGWVTLKNESGTAYRNARLQLVAGEVHRTPAEAAADRMKAARVMMAEAAAPPAFEREAFSEYHLYTLQRRTSVNDRETKQVTLLASPSVPVEKRFVVDGQEFYYRNPQGPGRPIKDAVKLYYRFRNDEKAGLGIPLPAGIVRVYQADSRGGVLFAGEDRIAHTPKDEVIDLYTGNAFDIVAERKQTDFRRVSSNTHEMEYEITIRNHKDAPVTVEVNEPIGGDWQMLDSSHKFTKTAAFAARFDVPVPRDGTSVLKYRVRARW